MKNNINQVKKFIRPDYILFITVIVVLVVALIQSNKPEQPRPLNIRPVIGVTIRSEFIAGGKVRLYCEYTFLDNSTDRKYIGTYKHQDIDFNKLYRDHC